MQSKFLTAWIVPTLIVSCAYAAAFVLTFGILMPVQDAIVPELMNYASMVFLPHGVRVLTAWLYGWRAIIFLLPATLATHAYLYGSMGFTGAYFFAPLSSILCATSSFWLLAKLGLDFRQSSGRLTSWREILLAGSLASIVNVIGVGYFFELDLRSASAFLVGDVGGLLAAMFMLMIAFRIKRNYF